MAYLAERCPDCNDILIHIEATMSTVCANCRSLASQADIPSDHKASLMFPTNHDPSHIERLTNKLRSLASSIHEADRGGTKSYILPIYTSEIDCSESIRRVLDKHGFKTLDVSTMGGMSILIKWECLMTGFDIDPNDL